MARLWVADRPERLAGLREAEQDVCNAGHVHELEVEESDAFNVLMELEAKTDGRRRLP